MRKFLLALLCLMLAVCTMFSLVACGDNTGGNSGGDTPGVENPGNSDDPEKQVFVTGVNLPANIRDYLVNSGERENKEQEFFVLNAPYKVGDDNAFRFLPETTFEDELEIPVHVEEHEYTYVLEEKLELSYEPLAETCIERVDTIACEFDFSEEAIGKTIRLTVTPTGLTEEQIGDVRYSVSFEFVVVDGYNVYDEIELGYMHYNALENHASCYDLQQTNVAWSQFLTENGYTRDPLSINALILQGNLNITAEDIPSHYVYTKEEIDASNIPVALRKYYYGTLKNGNAVGIYTRRMQSGNNNFAVLGNYYTIDVSNMPVVLKMDNKTVEFDQNGMVVASNIASTSQLFKIEGNLLNPEKFNVKFENFNLIGNSPKTNDKRAQGGLMFVKTENATTTIDNVISKRVFITISAKRTGKVNVTNLKCYDSFSSPFHVWMVRDGFYCDNVIAKNSGGPAIIVETAAPSLYHADYEADCVLMSKVIATNCVFENWNDGTEAWYYMGLGEMAATAMPMVKSINDIPKGVAQAVTAGYQQAGLDVTFNASFLKEDGQQQLFNVYCVVIDGKGGLAGASQSAYVEINGNVMDYGTGADYYTNLPAVHPEGYHPPVQDGYAYKKNNSENPYYSPTLAAVIQGYGFAQGAPILESTGGGIVIWDGANANFAIEGTEQAFITGDALNLYYSFPGAGLGTVGLMFEYMH